MNELQEQNQRMIDDDDDDDDELEDLLMTLTDDEWFARAELQSDESPSVVTLPQEYTMTGTCVKMGKSIFPSDILRTARCLAWLGLMDGCMSFCIPRHAVSLENKKSHISLCYSVLRTTYLTIISLGRPPNMLYLSCDGTYLTGTCFEFF